MSTKIASVDAGSPAERAGVRPGETLLEISGHRVVDVLDYKFYGYDARLTLTLLEGDEQQRTVKVRKEPQLRDLSHGPGPLLRQPVHFLLCGPDAAGHAEDPLFQGR